jgi:cytoskeletal protein CcmA (bactofilin family)
VNDSERVQAQVLIPIPKHRMLVMPIWKESTAPTKEPAIIDAEPAVKNEPDYPADLAPSTARRPARGPVKESIISADITITGKIVGAGHIRIAGNFEGDVHIEGDLTIDAGAKLTGSVRANSVTIGGEVDGNIESAASVEILATGILNGDLKAGTLAVASGSRMRGRVEFGWGEESSSKSALTLNKGRQAS